MDAVKSKLAKATGTSSPDPLSSEEAERYKLKVTAGPSYDQSLHRIVRVNSEDATYIENEFIRAKVKVRIRSYHGLPSSSPSHSAYFNDPMHEKDMYSIALSFVPKQEIPSVDTVWGNDFDHPVRDRLPPGFNTAFKIVKEFIDPGLQCDAYADEPWLYGPSLSCWFAFRIGDKVEDGQDFPAPNEEKVMREGADGSGANIRQKLGLPDNGDKRRKHYLSASNREGFTFEKGRLYQADFYNPYLDFGNFALKLPGFSLKVIKYVDQKSHCLRYVFKNRESGDMYLNVNFHLLWGEKLAKAVKEDQETQAQPQHTAPATNGGSDEEQHARHGQDAEQQQQANAGAESLGQRRPFAKDDAAPSNEPMSRSSQRSSSPRSSVQRHLDDHQASVDANSGPDANHGPTDRPPQSSDSPRSSVQRHLDDHRASVDANSGSSEPAAKPANDGSEPTDGAAEITDLLKDTSTSDRRDGRFV